MVTATTTIDKATSTRSAAECVIASMKAEARIRADHFERQGWLLADDSGFVPGTSSLPLRYDMSLRVSCTAAGVFSYVLRKSEGSCAVTEDEAVLLIAAAFSSDAEAVL